MPRPIQALIHADALAHNLRRARQACTQAKVWAVVKANAYGHGLEFAVPALRGADGFALLDLAEAAQVRALGWRGPVLLLEGVFEPRDLELCSRLDLWHVVHDDAQIDWLAAHKTFKPHRVFLKMNSGMNRLGFSPARFRAAHARLNALTQVEDIALMTHFSDADGARGVAEQLAVFERHSADLPGERSIANSATLLRHGELLAQGLRSDWVRAGIMLYGSAPDHPLHTAADWGLEPAMTLRTRVIGVQTLQPGQRVGYGGLFEAAQPCRVAIAACGYADGYPRHAPGGTPAVLAGRPTHTVGRVSMDMLAVAVPEGLADERLVGVEVVLWGRAQGEAVQPIDAVAHAAGTVGYELMCAVAPRVQKLSCDAA